MDEYVIVDKRGRSFVAYLTEDGSDFKLELTRNCRYVGDIYFSVDEAGEMDIGTIWIMDWAFRLERLWCYFTKQRAGYRRNGVGSALVSLAIQIAKEHGATHATGFISRPNFKDDPHLIIWWAKQGFNIIDAQKPGLAVAYIYKDI
jgi:GNAT superfamily N-acetyltransferase